MSAEAVRYVLAQNIKPAALKFYLTRVAYRLDNDKGYAWPAQDTIAKEMSVSVTSIKKYQATCEERGLLRATQPKGERGKFSSNHYVIPGFMDWMKQADSDAVLFFVRAMAEPQQPGVSTANPTVATRSGYGPQQPGVSTDRSNPECLQKERLKDSLKEEDEPKAVHPSRASQIKANKVEDEKSGYLTFCDKLKATIRAAGRKGDVCGLTDGRKVWAALNQAERNERYSALTRYGAHLKANTFKHPQHIDRFLRAGWEDFAAKDVAPAQEAKQAETKKWPACDLEAALEYARKPDQRGISPQTRSIFAGASQIPRDLWNHAQRLLSFETDHLAMTA